MAFNSTAPPTMEVINEELEEVETENLGFLALNGDSRLRLFSESFPQDALPPPSSSLFTVANRLGLFVAVGPNSLICGTTASLRKAFKEAESDLTDYSPSFSIPLPAKVTHVSFDAAEKYLVVGAQTGGIAVYAVSDISGLGSGQQPSPVFEVTVGSELREVKPNPAVESSQYFVTVTADGNVRMLDLEARDFVGGQGNSLKDHVTTVCWSQRGKAVVCGLDDGSGWQMKPDGSHMRTLPQVPDLENVYVSSIAWIENNLFGIVYTAKPSDPSEPTVDSHLYLYTSPPAPVCQFQKMPDPTPPFGMPRQSYHNCTRLFPWRPDLQDLLIYTNASSSDVGLLLRTESDRGDVPAHEFRVTTIANDSRRAELPLGADFSSTTPVGIALDLSSNDEVKQPIVGSELESTGPQPIFYILNNEGVLAGWHIIYSDAVNANIPYPLLATQAAQDTSAPQTPLKATQVPTVPATPAAASPFAAAANRPGAAFGSPSVMGGSAFGSGTAFGTPKPAFGQPSVFGTAGTPAPAFGQTSAFGAVQTPKPAFGAPSTLGSNTPFGRPAGAQPSFGTPSAFGAQPAFGQTSAFGTPQKPADAPKTDSPFGSGSAFGSGASFGRFAQSGGFGAVAAKPDAGSPWGKGSSLKTSSKEDSFGGLAAGASGGFGSASTPLKVSSLFQASKSETQEEGEEEEEGSKLFGGFGSAVSGALSSAPAVSKDADMDSEPSPPSSEMDTSAPSTRTELPTLGSAFAPKPTSAFGGSGTVSAFGSGTAFGQPSALKSVFGAPSDTTPKSAFGATTSTTPKTVFGSGAKPTSAFGSAFGAPSSSESPFKSAAPNTQSSPFGNAMPAFGAPSVKSAFPSSPAASPFGKQITPAFGQPSFASPSPAAQAPKPLPAPKETPLLKDRPESPAASQKSADSTPGEPPLPPDPVPSAAKAAEPAPPVTSAAKSLPLPPDSSSRPVYGPGDSSAEVSATSSKAEASPPETPEKSALQRTAAKESPVASSIFEKSQTFAGSMKPGGAITNPFANLTEKEARKNAQMFAEAKQEQEARKAAGRVVGGKGISPPGALHRRQPSKPFAHSPLSRRILPQSEEEEEEEEESGEDEEEEEDEVEYAEEEASDFEDFEEPETDVGSEQDAESEEAPEIVYQDEVERDMIQNQKVEPNPAPPKLELPPSTVSVSDQLGIAEAFEKLYESSNIMLNKIGVAARNLQSYVDAQNTMANRDVSFDSEPSEWRLAQVYYFRELIAKMEKHLAALNINERLEDDLQPLTQGIISVQTKIDPMPQLIKPASENASDRPLPPDHAILQKSLRTTLNNTEALVEKAGRELSLLRTALASRESGRKTGFTPPTVERVRNTIRTLSRRIVDKKDELEGLEAKLQNLSFDGRSSKYGGIDAPELENEFQEAEAKETLAMRRAREAKVRKAMEAKSVKFTRAAV